MCIFKENFKGIIYKVLSILDDKTFLKIKFYFKMKRKLVLDNPITYNDKLQWLKLHDRNPRYSIMVDKYLVKEYVASIIGKEHIIPTYGVWKNFDDINFDELPDKFVLKTNHDSGSVVICKNKSTFDYSQAKSIINRSLKRNFYLEGREYPYKDVKPLVLAEMFMEDKKGKALLDYKIMCFNGEPKLIELHNGRFTNHHTHDYYDVNWKKTTISQLDEFSDKVLPKPKQLDDLLDFSRKLAKNIPHCRVDWYIVKGVIYFGEITFFDASGFKPFNKYDDDLLLGSWINLNAIEAC